MKNEHRNSEDLTQEVKQECYTLTTPPSQNKEVTKSHSTTANPFNSSCVVDTSIIIQQAEPSQAFKHTSISPSIAEIERFILFLANRNKITLPSDLIVLIQKTESQIKGYYSPNSWTAFKHQEQEQEPQRINEITLSSRNLTYEPYETIAHEFAHYLNTILDNYKGNNRNYHTLDFKKRAEQMLLRCEKGLYGFNQTYETEAFKKMLSEEFKPNENAFKIFQPTDSRIVGIDGNGNPIDIDGNIVKPKPKGTSRLILFECECEKPFKIRCAKNEDKPLKAVCQYCNKEFKIVEKKPEPEIKPEVKNV